MRPSRILVGEVRAEECLDLLLALNAGVPGMCTLHANSAREALVKMCTLPLLAGENVSARFVVPTVAASVDLVVHLGIDQHGVRRVNEIVGVPGRVEHDVIEIEPIFERRGGDLRRSGGVPPHAERYERLGVDVHALLRRSRLMGVLVGLGVRCRAAARVVGVRPAAPSAPRAPRGQPRGRPARARGPRARVRHVVPRDVCGAGVRSGAGDAGRHAHAAGGPVVRGDGRATSRWSWCRRVLVAGSASSRRCGPRRWTTSRAPCAPDSRCRRRWRSCPSAGRSRCVRRSRRSRSTIR